MKAWIRYAYVGNDKQFIISHLLQQPNPNNKHSHHDFVHYDLSFPNIYKFDMCNEVALKVNLSTLIIFWIFTTMVTVYINFLFTVLRFQMNKQSYKCLSFGFDPSWFAWVKHRQPCCTHQHYEQGDLTASYRWAGWG